MKRSIILFVLAIGLVGLAQAQDADHQKWMKDISATNVSLNKNLAAKSPDAAADAKKLSEDFGMVKGYWHGKGAADAEKFAADSQAGYAQVADLASAGKFDEAAATAKTTSANCAGCHQAHRARQADGSWGFK